MPKSSSKKPPAPKRKKAPTPPKDAFPPLRLVVSNPPPVIEPFCPRKAGPATGFKARMHRKSPSQYVLYASHPFHYLKCRVALEIHDYDSEDRKEREPVAALCHFPNQYDEEAVSKFVERDEDLHAMLVIQFQLNILRQLLAFCRKKNASNLMIEVDSIDNAHAGHTLGVYHSLVTYQDRVPTKTGTRTHLVIPQTKATFARLASLVSRVNRKFRRTLWQDKNTNPLIREYLRSDPGLRSFF